MRRTHHQHGAMLTTLSLLVVILAVMVLIAIPVVQRTRRLNHIQECIDNQAQLLVAKEHYALGRELKGGAPMEIKDLMEGTSATLKVMPVCPDGGIYTLNPAGALPSCSRADLGHLLPMAGKKRTTIPGVVTVTSQTASVN